MAENDPLKSLDLSNASLEELNQIQNEVLRHIAVQARVNAEQLAAGHDSHGSSHSKNTVVADIAERITRPEIAAPGRAVRRPGGQ